jgi:Glycosyl transferase family 2
MLRSLFRLQRRYMASSLFTIRDEELPPECVYFVANASEDNSADLVTKRFPRVHVTRNSENRGFAGGTNQVLSMLAVSGDYRYAFLLNPDTVVPMGLVSGCGTLWRSSQSTSPWDPFRQDTSNLFRQNTKGSTAGVSSTEFHGETRRSGKSCLTAIGFRNLISGLAQNDPAGVLGVYYVQGSASFARMGPRP